MGDDMNSGRSVENAWKSLDKINGLEFGPGAVILLKAGQSWNGELSPAGSGNESTPVFLGSYGTGTRPVVHGGGINDQALRFYNQQFWTIRDLRFTNFNADDQNTKRLRGIYIQAEDAGAVSHIHLINVEVDSVNSEHDSFNSRYYGGIFFEVTGSKDRTWFENILVDSCYIHDLGRTGISNSSTWDIRSSSSNYGDFVGTDGNGIRQYDNWSPNKNFIIRRSTIRRIAGNGIIVRVADKPLVEYNLLDSCGLYISGNAAFCFNTDSALFQYNEARYTIYNEGDTDARGIDSDFRTKYTIIQYNYLHNNGYGGVVATGGSGADTWLERYNIGTVIRYNLIKDNKNHIVHTSGMLTDITIHNNVFYTSDDPDYTGLKIVNNGSWGGAYADGSYYYNNIFYHLGSNPVFNFGESTNNIFSNNIFFGVHAWNEPEDPYKITQNPLFVNGGSTDPEGYQIQPDSPAKLQGKRLKDLPDEDFFGNPLPVRGLPDIGVHQVSGASEITGMTDINVAQHLINIYPNPTNNTIHIDFDPEHVLPNCWRILNLAGSEYGTGVIGDQQNLALHLGRYGLNDGIFILELRYHYGQSQKFKFIYIKNT
jgi:hypothetical protein